jgi:predicted SAM-dependent methyltransferase
MLIQLGCGTRPFPKPWVNVDFVAGYADIVHDLTNPLPFDAGCADEIHAYHVFEHFQRWQAEAILGNWVDTLKTGGLLVLELPCFDKVIAIFSHYLSKKIPVPQWVMHGLYGDPKYRDPAMMHHWCYSVGELSGMMRRAGLQVELKEAQTHVPHRDMRLEGRKNAIIQLPEGAV